MKHAAFKLMGTTCLAMVLAPMFPTQVDDAVFAVSGLSVFKPVEEKRWQEWQEMRQIHQRLLDARGIASTPMSAYSMAEMKDRTVFDDAMQGLAFDAANMPLHVQHELQARSRVVERVRQALSPRLEPAEKTAQTTQALGLK